MDDRPDTSPGRQSIFENVRSRVIEIGDIIQNRGILIIVRLGRSEYSRVSNLDDIPPEISSAAERKFWRLVTLLLSGICTIGTLVLREQGVLQAWELNGLDHFVRLRPHEKPDPRILVVTVTESDLQKQQEGMLSDRTLSKALAKLEEGQPRVIGLDMYRDIPGKEGRQELLSRLKNNSKLVATCAGSIRLKKGIAPPLGVPRERLGFSDVVVDDDGVLRRHLLAMQPELDSLCKTNESLSFQLALHYLAGKGIQPQLTEKEEYRLGEVVFKPLFARRGAYRTVDTRGYQILLNYRAMQSPELVAQKVTMSDVLNGRVNRSWVNDRVVLIGVSAESVKDEHLTPYSSQLRPPQKLSGVFVHAQMVSQMLSAVLDGRSLLWVWPDWAEGLWIIFWSVVGGVVGTVVRSRILLIVAISAALGILVTIAWGSLLYGLWLPLIPSALGLIVTGGIVWVLHGQSYQQN